MFLLCLSLLLLRLSHCYKLNRLTSPGIPAVSGEEIAKNTKGVLSSWEQNGNRRNLELCSLSEYAMHRKSGGLGPHASSRWGKRMDRERKHNYGNVPGNEDIGGCNPEYKFAEQFFDDDEEVHQWPPRELQVHTGKLYWHLKGKDGGPYGSYKSLMGQWQLRDWPATIIFDRIQSDPFAPPSNIRIRILKSDHGFPDDIMTSKIRNIATCDYINRKIASEIKKLEDRGSRGAPVRSGFEIVLPKQYVLQRKTVVLNEEYLEVRMLAHLPANGRRINAGIAMRMFDEFLPTLIQNSMLFNSYDNSAFYKHVMSVEDQEYLRDKLPQLGLIGFVANGSVLPRETGSNDRPLQGDAVQPFMSPDSMKVVFQLPNKGKIEGMGIKNGVTLIVGGGYHGKTTLLEALQVGCYNKVPGDGREFVVVSPNTVKVRAEDGRSVTGVDISTFIGALPNGKNGENFSSSNASGSTSQAAIIMESIEMGADVLLVDEDISASNLMYRDTMMDALVSKSSEPITTFLLLVKKFHEKLGVSTILVSGSCGHYMDQADTIIQMNEYRCIDQTTAAKKIVREHGVDLTEAIESAVGSNELFQQELINSKVLSPQSFKRTHKKIKQRGKEKIQYGTEDIDLSHVEQIVETMQTSSITNMIIHLENMYNERKDALRNRTMRDLLEEIYKRWTDPHNAVGYNGLDEINGFKPFPTGECSMPRIFEVAAAINRMRNLKVAFLDKRKYEKQRYSRAMNRVQ